MRADQAGRTLGGKAAKHADVDSDRLIGHNLQTLWAGLAGLASYPARQTATWGEHLAAAARRTTPSPRTLTSLSVGCGVSSCRAVEGQCAVISSLQGSVPVAATDHVPAVASFPTQAWQAGGAGPAACARLELLWDPQREAVVLARRLALLVQLQLAAWGAGGGGGGRGEGRLHACSAGRHLWPAGMGTTTMLAACTAQHSRQRGSGDVDGLLLQMKGWAGVQALLGGDDRGAATSSHPPAQYLVVPGLEVLEQLLRAGRGSRGRQMKGEWVWRHQVPVATAAAAAPSQRAHRHRLRVRQLKLGAGCVCHNPLACKSEVGNVWQAARQSGRMRS